MFSTGVRVFFTRTPISTCADGEEAGDGAHRHQGGEDSTDGFTDRHDCYQDEARDHAGKTCLTWLFLLDNEAGEQFPAAGRPGD